MSGSNSPHWSSELISKLNHLLETDQFTGRSYGNVMDHAVTRWIDELTSDPRTALAENRAWRAAFEIRLVARWGKALDLFEIVLMLAIQASSSAHERKRTKAVENNDLTFDVLERLHARACRIASEVLTLLQAGHAPGAHARWRTLHEVTVVAYFIEKHGHQTAERYHLHNAIESYKAAVQYDRHHGELGFEPLDPGGITDMKRKYHELVTRFGKDFTQEYGWAADVLPGRVSFARIEEHVGLERFRPLYRMASQDIHANPKGILWSLGIVGDRDMIIAGPTNAGLADPGHGALVSLFQITTLFLNQEPDLEDVLTMQAIGKLESMAGEAFLAAQKQLELEEAELAHANDNGSTIEDEA